MKLNDFQGSENVKDDIRTVLVTDSWIISGWTLVTSCFTL